MRKPTTPSKGGSSDSTDTSTSEDMATHVSITTATIDPSHSHNTRLCMCSQTTETQTQTEIQAQIAELKSIVQEALKTNSKLEQRIEGLEYQIAVQRETLDELQLQLRDQTTSTCFTTSSTAEPFVTPHASPYTSSHTTRNAHLMLDDQPEAIPNNEPTPAENDVIISSETAPAERSPPIPLEIEEDLLNKKLLAIKNAGDHALRSIRQAKSDFEGSAVKHLGALQTIRGEGVKLLKITSDSAQLALKAREKELNTYIDSAMAKVKVAESKATTANNQGLRHDSDQTLHGATAAYSDPALKKLLNDILKTKADERREVILARTLGPTLPFSSYNYGYRRPATFIDPNNVDGMDLETYLAAYNGEYEYEDDYHYDRNDVLALVGKGVHNRKNNERLRVSCGGARSFGELLHLIRCMTRDQVEDLMGEWLIDIVRMEMDKIKQSHSHSHVQAQAQGQGKKGKKRN
ncbi:hypothetical protein IAT40_000325 [Kwoniella sp. CBS 6097]